MSNSFPILYTFRRCPYAMRARIALYTAQVDHEHREVDLKNKPQEMLAISPKGTVPVLQFESGRILEESLDIMKWAFNTSDLPLEEARLVTENDTTFKRALDRYKYPGRYLEEAGVDYREQCELFLRKLEARLDPFLAGTTAALGDIALFPFIRQFTMVDRMWFEAQPYPRIKNWLSFFISSALFERVMEKYPLWMPENQPTIIKFVSHSS